jgi:predicted transcriptional regulator
VYFGLEGVAVDLWQYVQIPRTFSEVIAHLESRFDVAHDVCEATISAFIEELARRELVVLKMHGIGV